MESLHTQLEPILFQDNWSLVLGAVCWWMIRMVQQVSGDSQLYTRVCQCIGCIGCGVPLRHDAFGTICGKLSIPSVKNWYSSIGPSLVHHNVHPKFHGRFHEFSPFQWPFKMSGIPSFHLALETLRHHLGLVSDCRSGHIVRLPRGVEWIVDHQRCGRPHEWECQWASELSPMTDPDPYAIYGSIFVDPHLPSTKTPVLSAYMAYIRIRHGW